MPLFESSKLEVLRSLFLEGRRGSERKREAPLLEFETQPREEEEEEEEEEGKKNEGELRLPVQKPVFVDVRYRLQQLSQETLDFPLEEGVVHGHHQIFEIVFKILHHQVKGIVVLANHNFFCLDHVGMIHLHEDGELSQSSDREGLIALDFELLEGHHLPCFPVPGTIWGRGGGHKRPALHTSKSADVRTTP